MSIFDFKRRFGQTVAIEEVKRSFVNKINRLLLREVDRYFREGTTGLFDHVCSFLNKDSEKIIHEYNNRYLYGSLSNRLEIPSIKYFTKNEFDSTLPMIEALYTYFEDLGNDEWLGKIDRSVGEALEQPISLGISWRDGEFYPEGAKELEKALVDEPLKWLENYPEVRELYQNAQDHYSQSLKTPIKRKDAISNAFQAVEKVTRIVLGNQESFDNNFKELVEKVELHPNWKGVLNHYKELSKEFGRHPGREEFIPNKSDTEAFLYLSGIVLRLILERLGENRA